MLNWIILALLAIAGFTPEVDGQCVNSEQPHTPEAAVTVKSPNFGHGYPSNLSCEWKFVRNKAYSMGSFRIEFITFQLQPSWGCNRDYLQILSNSTVQGLPELTTIGRWCDVFPKYLDVFTDLVIRFHSDSDGNNKGFELTILPERDFSFCRNDIVQKLQVSSLPHYLYSPGYPVKHPVDAKCAWRLEAPDGEHVQVESVGVIDTFNNNELSIHGAGNKSVYFWHNQDVFATSTGNVLDIEFTSSFTWARRRSDVKGFVFKYYTSNLPENTTCVPPDPTTVLASNKPSLISLYFPGHSSECSWIIKARTDEVVVLETINWNTDIYHLTDSLYIYDGPSNMHTLILDYPGSSRPFGMVRSSGQDLFLEAHTPYYSRPGTSEWWSMKFSSRNKLDLNENYLPAFKTPSVIWVPALKSKISSPYWKIHAVEPGKCVFVEALSESYQEVEGSFQQYFAAFDGVNASAQQLKICAPYKYPSVTGSQQSMRIQVDHDSTTGFWFRYHSTDSCEGQDVEVYYSSTQSTNVIRIPFNYSSIIPYPGGVRCHWKIKAHDYRNYIHLESTDMRLKLSLDCDKNYLEVYDSLQSRVPMTKWCGKSKFNMTSTSYQVVLVFQLDKMEAGQGFEISYKSQPREMCSAGVTALMMEKYLSSPGFPHYPYSNNLDCEWRIHAEADSKVIKLEIRHLSLDDDHCADYVVIYDGLSRQSRLGKLCGVSKETSSYMSTGPGMYIVFKTNFMGASSGFRFAYYLQDKTVFEDPDSRFHQQLNATLEKQSFRSPYCPMQYENNMTCMWTIRSFSQSYAVQVQVLDSGLEYSHNCNLDYVQVYDGTGSIQKKLGRWCGQSFPIFASSGMYMTLAFKSDSQSLYKGFRIHYWSILSSTNSSEKSMGFNNVALIGGIISGVAAIFILVFFLFLFFFLRFRRGTARTESAYNSVAVSRTNSVIQANTDNNVDLSAAPPSYHELLNPMYINNPKYDPPPSYPASEYEISRL